MIISDSEASDRVDSKSQVLKANLKHLITSDVVDIHATRLPMSLICVRNAESDLL